jgi:hypothetical protein
VAIPIRTRAVFAPEPGCATLIERNDERTS